MENKKIMIVEDESIVALHIESSLKKLGYSVPAIVVSGEEAIQKAEELHPDLILMDIILQGEINGIEATRQIQDRFDIPVVYVTAFGDESTLQQAKLTQPFGFILKPFKERELQIAMEIALYRHDMEAKLMKIERLLAITLHSIGDAVISTDTRGKISFLNHAAEIITGWKHEDALHKNLAEVFNIKEFESKSLLELIKAFIKDGIFVDLISENSILITKDGTEIPVSDSFARIIDNEGNIPGAVIVFRDTTINSEVEKSTRNQIIELERQLKESKVQHELMKNELERSRGK